MAAPTLIATPGSPVANVYILEAEATDYLSNSRLYTPEWAAATVDDRSKALIWATEFLDNQWDWFGYKATKEQALRWPRSGVYDPDDFYVPLDIVPQVIQHGCAQTAYEFIKTNRVVQPALFGQGIDDVTAGPVHVHINFAATLPFVPPYIALSLSRYGVALANGGPLGVTQAKLLRV